MWKLSKKSNRQKSSLKTKKKTGFTLIEILLVVTIIGILSGLSLPFYSRLILQNTISDTAENLRKAQIYTIAGKDGSDWAVNYSNRQIKLIRQSTGTVFDIYNVSDSVTISSLSQVVFSRPSGQPDITGTFNVSDGNDTKAVTLNSEGVAGVSN